MSYFRFLLAFLAVPTTILLVVLRGAWQRGEHSMRLNGKALGWAIAGQVLLAVTYTTPWDNYLVATGVWHYRAGAVAGILLGYVPLEEYMFFVLEAIFVGAWWKLMAQTVSVGERFRASIGLRIGACAAVASLWLASLAILLSGWRPGVYLSLILTWALPSLLIQTAFGADVLWHNRRRIAAVIFPVGIYLSLADAVAIAAGIWTIDPSQSTGIFIGRLPVEEALFFLVTVILLTFGLTLSLAEESRSRIDTWLVRMRQYSLLPGGRPIK